MTDTPPEIAELVRQKLMARSNEERFLMGVQSFEAARAMVLASLPAGLPPEELKRRLFQRIYGYPLPIPFPSSAGDGANTKYSMRPGHIQLPKSPEAEAAEAARAAGYARKQKWKELPGNRYTPEELREMSASLGSLVITEQETPVMHLE